MKIQRKKYTCLWIFKVYSKAYMCRPATVTKFSVSLTTAKRRHIVSTDYLGKIQLNQSYRPNLRKFIYNNWLMHASNRWIIYRLITAYSLLRVNLDKIMHARWNFDASSARTRRVSALDKHQNWSASALFCLNSRAQSKYAVVNLIHTRRKKLFVFYYVINKTF